MTDKERGEIIEQLRELQDQADEWLQSEPRALGREFHRGQVDGFRQAILVVHGLMVPHRRRPTSRRECGSNRMRDAALEEAIRAWRAKAGWKPLFQSDEDHFIAGYRAAEALANSKNASATTEDSEGPA